MSEAAVGVASLPAKQKKKGKKIYKESRRKGENISPANGFQKPSLLQKESERERER